MTIQLIISARFASAYTGTVFAVDGYVNIIDRAVRKSR